MSKIALNLQSEWRPYLYQIRFCKSLESLTWEIWHMFRLGRVQYQRVAITSIFFCCKIINKKMNYIQKLLNLFT